MPWQDVVASWRHDDAFVDIRELPGRPARWVDLPTALEPRLCSALWSQGVGRLYSHQLEAFEAAAAGLDVVVTTPTASGKSLCYNLPVFDALLRDPTARALYLYPTKALARDQVAALRGLSDACGGGLGIAVHDGDTPGDHRRRSRDARILATNPDMLHAGILPHHASWAAFFAGLRYIVVDELHTCRGLYGSGVANVLRRLRRVAAFHGSSPRAIATSATVGNPEELASRVLGSASLRHISESGAPSPPRTFLLYNPPIIDSSLGLRGSYLKATERLTRALLDAGVNTLVFARSRRAVEILVRYLRDDSGLGEDQVRGYRGGYLPGRRREVENLLRSGEARAVVATSALELGVDIGGLEAVVLAGWPGSRAAAWQRAGRAGRRGRPAVVVLVSCSEPLDQYVAGDPEYLFGGPPEHARLDPDNLAVLVPHIKCAAFELPFRDGETFGALDADETREVLVHLAAHGLVHEAGGRFHWIASGYPAQGVPLRGGADENFAVIDARDGQVLAEVDHRDASRQLHPNAIYPLEGRLHEVKRLDFDAHKAYVEPADVDYTTDAETHTKVRVLQVHASDDPAGSGDVHVIESVVGFKKIKLHTHENVGYGEVTLPPFELHTRSFWLDPLAPPGPRAAHADAVGRAAYALEHVAALLVLCDGGDLRRTVVEAASPAHLPRIHIFDACPGGAGLSDRLYDARVELLELAVRLLDACACPRGCPGCVGPIAPSVTTTPKQAAAGILGGLLARLRRRAA